jgi:hypothetical protein
MTYNSVKCYRYVKHGCTLHLRMTRFLLYTVLLNSSNGCFTLWRQGLILAYVSFLKEKAGLQNHKHTYKFFIKYCLSQQL